MDKLTAAGLNGTEPVVFATNLLDDHRGAGQPEGHHRRRRSGQRRTSRSCSAPPEVPCGKYAKQIFDTAGVTVTPVSLEQNVKGVVTKVTAGEADAGIVYVTDVTAAGDEADGVDIPADINVVAQYPIASVKTSTNARGRPGVHRLPPRRRRPGDHGEVRLRRAVTTTAPARPVAVHRRVGRERLPLPVLILAIVAIGVLRAAVHRAAVEGAVGRRVVDPHLATARSPRCGCRCTARCGRRRWPSLFGVPLAWLLARIDVPGPERWRGRCARCRWCCRPSSPASPCSTRSAAAGWSASTSTGGSASRCRSRPPA